MLVTVNAPPVVTPTCQEFPPESFSLSVAVEPLLTVVVSAPPVVIPISHTPEPESRSFGGGGSVDRSTDKAQRNKRVGFRRP